MKEMILLFNPPAKEQLLKIRSALLPLHIRIQLIKPEQYNQPLKEAILTTTYRLARNELAV